MENTKITIKKLVDLRYVATTAIVASFNYSESCVSGFEIFFLRLNEKRLLALVNASNLFS